MRGRVANTRPENLPVHTQSHVDAKKDGGGGEVFWIVYYAMPPKRSAYAHFAGGCNSLDVDANAIVAFISRDAR